MPAGAACKAIYSDLLQVEKKGAFHIIYNFGLPLGGNLSSKCPRDRATNGLAQWSERWLGDPTVEGSNRTIITLSFSESKRLC